MIQNVASDLTPTLFLYLAITHSTSRESGDLQLTDKV
jgi:hypothetical protein